MQFIRGQKQKLSALTGSLRLKAVIDIDWKAGDDLDIACFGLDASGKLSDDRYFIFFNQTASPEGALRVTLNAKTHAEFDIDLAALPQTVRRLTFTAAVDGQSALSQAGSGSFRLMDGNSEILSFAFSGSDFSSEKAAMLFDIYFKDEWRIAAVGQGFKDGLKALLEHFGGTAIEASPAPAPKPAAPPAEAPNVSLSKITLEKRGDSQKIDLRKKDGSGQSIHINLNWDQTAAKKSFFGLKSSAADLDLGCMYELKDGGKNVIQALGGNFGSRQSSPWIFLDKDDRSGVAADGENLYVLQPDKIRRVLVFAFIYEGAGNFSDVHGRVIAKDSIGNEITINLDAPDSKKNFCAICMLENTGESLRITKEERYFRHHEEADNAYGFGFRWTSGSK